MFDGAERGWRLREICQQCCAIFEQVCRQRECLKAQALSGLICRSVPATSTVV